MRATEEWIGKSDDTAVPRRVRFRVFILADGQCANCTRKLRAGDEWQLDHRVALCNGGGNRETNLQILCEGCHKPKTVFDVAEKSRTYHKRAAHLGIKRKGHPMPGSRASGWRKRMDGTVERR